ncbi:tyrosine-type recombinase/integrase [Brevibacillus sp. SYSU BS000544]|uniref:tyrosine-type recombinase/integrase n=1 Tax=Brevibacillus sp. SYSU BS000544 TaxID=3416443 RepID=UPI003CE4623F
MEILKISIEEKINLKSTIAEALEAMKDYKNWSNSTFICYQNDVLLYEDFLHENRIEPILENGKLHLIQRWIKNQRDRGVSSTTIKRRIASLSSVFSFYRDLGVVQQNCFKAVDVPPGNQEHHSRVLEMDELKKVYMYADELRKTDSLISPTIKMLIFTGLRNEVLSELRVEHVNFEKSLLYVSHSFEKINSKHRVQIIPIPPKLLAELEQHVVDQQLLSQDKLLFGLAGKPLGEKALNRLTNRISHDLGWTNDNRVTPHGFRATISTILSEKGVDLAAIKFLLGHSEQDNLQFYIRRYGRHIRLLQRELTCIEEDLSQEPKVIKEIQYPDATKETEHQKTTQMTYLLPKEILLKLLDTDPELASILIQKGLAHV